MQLLVLVAVPLLDVHKKELHPDYRRRVEQEVEKINETYPGLVTMYQRRMPFAERVETHVQATELEYLVEMPSENPEVRHT